MEKGQVEKTTKAKLYNLKSGIEGLVQLYDSGVVQAEQVGAAIMSLSVRAVDELTEFLAKDNPPES